MSSPAVKVQNIHHPIVSRPELLSNGSDELFRNFIHGILALGERWNTVRAGFGEHIGISGIQYTILISIAHMSRNSNVSVKRIADHLHLSGTFITTVTGQLEKSKLIRKVRDKDDRRKVKLVLTEKGKLLLKKLEDVEQQVNDEMFACLSNNEFQVLSKIVDNLINCADCAISLQNHLRMRD